MGNGESAEFGENPKEQKEVPDDAKISRGYFKMDDAEIDLFNEDDELDFDNGRSIIQNDILKMPFIGIWSMRSSSGKVPPPRTGHFTAYSQEMHMCFIGYGKIGKGEYTNDVWALNVDTFKWSKLKLSGDVISPRKGSFATMMGQYIVVYGGVTIDGKRGDLHTIDVTTGEIIIAQTSGEKPAVRRDGCIAIYKRKLFVWGENKYNCLSILDFDTMKWKSSSSKIRYNKGCSYAVGHNSIFLYGGSTSTDLIIVDLKNESIVKSPTSKPRPAPTIVKAGAVYANGYIFYIGGLSETRVTMMFGCSIATCKWFVFYIAPDGETTSTSDGRITGDGLFLLPSIYGFSAIYVEHKREIHAFLGHPLMKRPIIHTLTLDGAFCYLNMKDDMISMLNFKK
ncbi:Kelch motif family protein [Histomonas meleagridis]|uniref:Kelch motif family protein n=1 Tax=Histomonas meleagridis TaxID=135588 RepID=UPI00355A90A7|nr:Kelch motif family protein [Histomonas meleagridis]KAH0798717.1 Kelch motif family protein [Histomonas meleagridis]